MGEEIVLENGRISNFHRLVTLNRVILHTVMHHSSTSTYIPNFIKIEENFCERTDRCTDGCMDGRTFKFFKTHFISSTRRSQHNNKDNGKHIWHTEYKFQCKQLSVYLWCNVFCRSTNSLHECCQRITTSLAYRAQAKVCDKNFRVCTRMIIKQVLWL